MNARIALVLILMAVTAWGCNVPVEAAAPVPGSQAAITPPVTAEYVPTPIPITPTYEGCAYVWGSKQLRQLSSDFNAALQSLGTGAAGMAYAYGENCVYADGRSTFSAMETDFRVGIQVKTVNDEAALGDWIYRVMQVVLSLPASEMEGPQPGRVEFNFKQPDPAEVFVTVPIDVYKREAQGMRGAILFQYFYKKP